MSQNVAESWQPAPVDDKKKEKSKLQWGSFGLKSPRNNFPNDSAPY